MFLISPSGRNRRLRYLVILVVCLLLAGGAYRADQATGSLLGIVGFWVHVVNDVRRLHDTDHGGWWVLLNLIPVVNFLLLLYLLFARSYPRRNQWGPAHDHRSEPATSSY